MRMVKRAAVALLGLVLGGTSALGVSHLPLTAGSETEEPPAEADVALEYVDLPSMILPVVDAQGTLTGYVAIEARLEVPAGTVEAMAAGLPLVRHEVNLAAWSRSLSQGTDGRLVDAVAAQRLYEKAARRIFGQKAVRRVLLTTIRPA